MDELAQSLNNSVTVSQGAGQPFREIEKRLLLLTAKARASVGADGWGDDPKTILLFKCTPDGCGPSRFLTVRWAATQDAFGCLLHRGGATTNVVSTAKPNST